MGTLMVDEQRRKDEFGWGEIEPDSGGGGGHLNQGFMDNEVEPTKHQSSTSYHLDKFSLFETPSYYYMVGRDKEKKHWRVLKIDRLESSELVFYEDPTIYSYSACKLFLQGINEGNKLTGGHKHVATCYGIVGFIRFLGPYYIIIITERKEIGEVFGHPVYSVSEYKMIPIPDSTVWYMDNSDYENRYRRLLQLVDITKNFYFSYTYPIMCSLQKNLNQTEKGHSSDRTMFVWNDYLTHHIRNCLKNTLWTVALVHGFFNQVMLSEAGKTFCLTLIARRSRFFAGPRYHKRGINEEGHAANDVEIEQIVSQKMNNGDCQYKVNSVVQNRGSIPLCWSQKSSLGNLKPDILFEKGDNSYAATQLHFQNLRLRYGDHIIILNLVKTCGNDRESLLRDEFGNAVDSINESSSKKYQLQFWGVNLDEVFRNEGTDVLTTLEKKAAKAMKLIGFFSCQVPESIKSKASFDLSYSWYNTNYPNYTETKSSDGNNNVKQQKGILRSNCLDSLDRTNVAQYVYSIVGLRHQLHDLMITQSPEVEFDQTLANDVMDIYQAMGDALAQQYGGSAAHSKIFDAIRGRNKAQSEFLKFFIAMHRHCSNSFWDSDRQEAIDLFLGHFVPDADESIMLEEI